LNFTVAVVLVVAIIFVAVVIVSNSSSSIRTTIDDWPRLGLGLYLSDIIHLPAHQQQQHRQQQQQQHANYQLGLAFANIMLSYMYLLRLRAWPMEM